MILEFDNIWTFTNDISSEEISIVSELLTYIDEKAKHTKAYKRKRWTGKRTLYSKRYRNFPTGLLPLVIDRLKQQNIDYSLIDNRPETSSPDYQNVECKYSLWYHQKEAIKEFLKKKDGRRGIFKLSTRSGKTILAAWLMIHLNLPSIFIVPDKRLLHQTRESIYKAFGVECGVLGDSTIEPRLHNIAIINTLARYLKEPRSNEDPNKFNTKASMIHGLLNRINFLIFDECHLSSKDYQLVSRHAPLATWRLGLSATPLLGDYGQQLRTQALTGPIIYEQEISDLVERGLVIKPTIIFLQCNHDPSNEMMEWQDAYDEGVVYNDKRNKMIAVAAITMFNKDKKVLILVEAIDQGNSILEILRKKNLEVDFIYGKHSGEQRSEANNKIQSGELDILIASRVYNQGIDIPLIDCVIIGGGYKSAILTYQRYGRGMTKRGDKTETIVIDFFDKGSYFLEKHSQERISLVNEEKAFKIKYKTIGEL